MPVFLYKAVTAGGEIIEGQREEADQAAVVRWIQHAGYIPLRAEPRETAQRRIRWTWRPHRSRRVSRTELGALTEELAVLLKAGVPLEQALQISRDVSDDEAGTKLLGALLEGVRGGKSFSAALEAEGRSFSPLFINIVRTSEAAGTLDQGLEQLNEHLQREKALRDEIVSATLYPLILCAVAIFSLGLILTYVIPKISELFVGYEEMLPLSTTVVIGTADFVTAYWWLLLSLALVLLLLIRHQLTLPSGKLRWDRSLLRLPVVGDLITKVEVARLSRSLATLLDNGVPLVNALPLACGSLSNSVLVQFMKESMEALKDGGTLSGMFAGAPFFPSLAQQLIKVGEETGNLEGMLAKVATIYEEETRKAARRMLSILEPVLIVGLGIVIGGIILSIMMAIISVNELPL